MEHKRTMREYLYQCSIRFVYNNRVIEYSLDTGTLVRNEAARNANIKTYKGEDISGAYILVKCFTVIMNFTRMVKGEINMKQELAVNVFKDYMESIPIVKNCELRNIDEAEIELKNGTKTTVFFAIAD